MLKGGWLPGIAIILILLFAIWVGLKIGYQDGYGDGGDNATTYQHDSTIIDGAAPESGISNEQTKRDEWRDEEDLNAQRNMAYWAAAMFVAAVGTLIVTGIGVLYIAKTLEATRDAVREAENATKAALKSTEETTRIASRQIRAYLSISAKIKKPIVGKYLRVKVIIKNTGQTPAKRFRCGVGFGTGPNPFDPNMLPVYAVDKNEGKISVADIGAGSEAMIPNRSNNRLTQELLDRIAAEKAAIIVNADFKYFDVFGTEQSGSMLKYLTGAEAIKGGRMQTYTVGNDQT